MIELAATAVLAESDNHGYAVAQRLTEAGFGRMKGGVLYPVLARLESEGILSSTWTAGEGGPGRKVYALTDRGAVAGGPEQRSGADSPNAWTSC